MQAVVNTEKTFVFQKTAEYLNTQNYKGRKIILPGQVLNYTTDILLPTSLSFFLFLLLLLFYFFPSLTK
jgi:hypothetical protein